MATTSIKYLSYAIYESSKEKEGKELDILIKNIIALIDKKQMLSKTDKILSTLEKIIDKDNGIIKVKISSCSKISEKMIKEIEDYIKKRYKAKIVEVSVEEDKKLLGGIKIDIGDEILDATLSNKVHKLQTYLIEN